MAKSQEVLSEEVLDMLENFDITEPTGLTHSMSGGFCTVCGETLEWLLQVPAGEFSQDY